MILRGHRGCVAPVVPGHPLRRVYGHFRRMPEQLRQVVERIDLIQFAGVDQAHEEVAHARSVHCFVEERILTMQDGFLQHSFGDVVVEWRARLSQEQCQFRPVPEQVRDCLAQPGVRFCLVLRKLILQP